MVNEISPKTEQRILEAALVEFAEKGMDGARMQSIADKAGINKSLLHYYYRSKEKLFEVVFQILFKTIIPKFSKIITNEGDIFDKIRLFVHEYIGTIQKMPHIPGFILHELGSNPIRLSNMIQNSGGIIHFDTARDQLQTAIAQGRIRPIAPEQFLLNMVSLCVFPFLARPIGQTILAKGDSKIYDQIIEDRKKEVAEFIINAIKNPDYEESQS